MTIDPFKPIETFAFALIAFVIAAIVFGVGGYLYGHAKGEASKAESVGALKASVDSCTVAAKESNKLVERERQTAELRENALLAALADNAKARPQYRAAADRAMAYQPKGATECERTVDAVRATVMGGAR